MRSRSIRWQVAKVLSPLICALVASAIWPDLIKLEMCIRDSIRGAAGLCRAWQRCPVAGYRHDQRLDLVVAAQRVAARRRLSLIHI